MSEEMVVEQCSPTMAGLKTGNLFSCPAEDAHTLRQSIRRLNQRLVPCGIRLLPVKHLGDRELIYMYRPEKLRRDLREQGARAILREKRYPADDPERCVVELVRRLNREKEFPHEIGLFLGYPAEDVSGFIRHGARCAKCVGTWKVYGDEEAARKKFALYQKCTRLYCEAYRKHNNLDRLLVRTHGG